MLPTRAFVTIKTVSRSPGISKVSIPTMSINKIPGNSTIQLIIPMHPNIKTWSISPMLFKDTLYIEYKIAPSKANALPNKDSCVFSSERPTRTTPLKDISTANHLLTVESEFRKKIENTKVNIPEVDANIVFDDTDVMVKDMFKK